jgi:CRP-like cAMP-binding protein
VFEQIRTYYTNLIPKLTNVEWNALENKLTIKHFKKGEAIVKQGEVCNYVYFINKGFCRLFKVVDGKEIATGFIEDNEYISVYDSFLTRQPAFESLEALEDTELICLSYTDMQVLYQQYPIFETFGRKIAEQLFIWTVQRSNALLMLSPEQRYINMIENNAILIQKVPQYMLASYIGVTPEHLSRIRKKMLSK